MSFATEDLQGMNLRVFPLSHTLVTDAGLALMKLADLDLRKIKISAEALQALAAALPQCRTASGHGVIEPRRKTAPGGAMP